MNKTFGFIGAGRITRIILSGLQKAGILPQQVIVSDPDDATIQQLRSHFPMISSFVGNNEKAAAQEIVFLAVDPSVMPNVLNEIRPIISEQSLLVSLVPKYKIGTIANCLEGHDRIVRMIPNAPSIINQGYNPMVFSEAIALEEKLFLKEYFSVLGNCPEVSEGDLEAYVILTAVGPTYFWFQLQELMTLAQSFGLTEDAAKVGLKQMLMGTVDTLFDSGLPPKEVMNLVKIKPLQEAETQIQTLYQTQLNGLLQKITQ
jgi:pyrroline-5-carboxylate reductase